MLRDESSCDGGSIVEKLESFVQGTVRMVEHNSAHCCKLYATPASLTSQPFLATTVCKLLLEFAALIE